MTRLEASSLTPVFVVACIWSGAVDGTHGAESVAKSRVTRYDLATPNELLLEHLLAPRLLKDVQAWSNQLLGGLPSQVGDWVTPYLDTIRIASTITQAFPVEGQPALRPVDALVEDCARTLERFTPESHTIHTSPKRGEAIFGPDPSLAAPSG